MDKTFLVRQLTQKLKALADQARGTAVETRDEAKTGANRAVNLARGTEARFVAAVAAVQAVEQFQPKPLVKGQGIGLGAVVEIENDEGGKTLFLAPAGAGEELTGPEGDGFFQVVTPFSPLGKALLGRKVGEVIETMVRGDVAEWTITYAA
jgi:transcription elongation GreA/GreB family factor